MLDELITQQVLALDEISTQGLAARAMRKAQIQRAHQIAREVNLVGKVDTHSEVLN